MVEVHWTLGARDDLAAIQAFIAKDSPGRAPRFAAEIADSVRRIAQFPRSGRRVPESDDESIREVIFQNYRVIYQIRGDVIGIVTVCHAAMDVARALEDRDEAPD